MECDTCKDGVVHPNPYGITTCPRCRDELRFTELEAKLKRKDKVIQVFYNYFFELEDCISCPAHDKCGSASVCQAEIEQWAEQEVESQ